MRARFCGLVVLPTIMLLRSFLTNAYGFSTAPSVQGQDRPPPDVMAPFFAVCPELRDLVPRAPQMQSDDDNPPAITVLCSVSDFCPLLESHFSISTVRRESRADSDRGSRRTVLMEKQGQHPLDDVPRRALTLVAPHLRPFLQISLPLALTLTEVATLPRLRFLTELVLGIPQRADGMRTERRWTPDPHDLGVADVRADPFFTAQRPPPAGAIGGVDEQVVTAAPAGPPLELGDARYPPEAEADTFYDYTPAATPRWGPALGAGRIVALLRGAGFASHTTIAGVGPDLRPFGWTAWHEEQLQRGTRAPRARGATWHEEPVLARRTVRQELRRRASDRHGYFRPAEPQTTPPYLSARTLYRALKVLSNNRPPYSAPEQHLHRARKTFLESTESGRTNFLRLRDVILPALEGVLLRGEGGGEEVPVDVRVWRETTVPRSWSWWHEADGRATKLVVVFGVGSGPEIFSFQICRRLIDDEGEGVVEVVL